MFKHPTALVLCLLAALMGGCGDSNSKAGDGGLASDGPKGGDGSAAQATRTEIINGCIASSACGLKVYPSLSACVAAYYNLHRSLGLGPIYDSIYRCVNAAKGDCQAIEKCHGRGGTCDQSYVAQCKGTVAHSCDLIEKRVYQLDCGLASMVCGIKTGQTYMADCTPGTCDASFKEQCQGSRELTCSAGIIELRECAELGMTCGYGGGFKATYGCKGETSQMCFSFGKDPFKSSCDGATALTCVGGTVHKEDCKRHELLNTACTGASCVPAGTQCVSELNRCNGEKLEACMDGTWKQFDCKTLGFGPCVKGSSYGANCS